MEEPVPQARVAGAGTLVSPAAGLCRATLPWRALLPPSPLAARSCPAPAARPALAFSWVAVRTRVCCETKSDPLALRQPPRARAADATAPPGARRALIGAGTAAEGAQLCGPDPRASVRPPHPSPPAPLRPPSPVGTAARYAKPPGWAQRARAVMGLRTGASCGDRPAAVTRGAAPPGLAALGRCTWKDVPEAGLFSFGEVVTDWDIEGTEGECSWPYSML